MKAIDDMNRNIPFFIDVIFCTVLLPMMIMLLPVEKWIANNWQFVLLLVVWLYTVYFVNRKLTVPWIIGRKKLMWALLIILGMVLVTFFLAHYRMGYHEHAHEFFVRRRGPKIRMQEQGVWFLFFVVECFSFAVGLLVEVFRQMVARREVEYEKNKAELALYKAQINPHFMFNTLNTIYGLLVTQSDKAEQAFVQFTEMLKYMYSDGTRDRIPLAGEIEYIRQYIDIQKLRLNEHATVNFSAPDNCEPELEIAPMILITFVENAFKYGISSFEDCSINIVVQPNGNELYFMTENRILSAGKKGAGIGISNCRKRLALLYPDRHLLNISEEGGMYRVVLTITLK